MMNSPHSLNTLYILFDLECDALDFHYCQNKSQYCVTYRLSHTIHNLHLSCMQGNSCAQSSLNYCKAGGIVLIKSIRNN